MSNDRRKCTEIEELPRDVEELTPAEAEEARGRLGMLRLLQPAPPPIAPILAPLEAPQPPPI